MGQCHILCWSGKARACPQQGNRHSFTVGEQPASPMHSFDLCLLRSRHRSEETVRAESGPWGLLGRWTSPISWTSQNPAPNLGVPPPDSCSKMGWNVPHGFGRRKEGCPLVLLNWRYEKHWLESCTADVGVPLGAPTTSIMLTLWCRVNTMEQVGLCYQLGYTSRRAWKKQPSPWSYVTSSLRNQQSPAMILLFKFSAPCLL